MTLKNQFNIPIFVSKITFSHLLSAGIWFRRHEHNCWQMSILPLASIRNFQVHEKRVAKKKKKVNEHALINLDTVVQLIYI